LKVRNPVPHVQPFLDAWYVLLKDEIGVGCSEKLDTRARERKKLI